MSYYGTDGPYGDDDDDDWSDDSRWERVQEMEEEVEQDGGDPVDLYDFE